LADEQSQGCHRRINPIPKPTAFLPDRCRHNISRQHFPHSPCRLITDLPPKPLNCMLQAFFCYLYTWLILFCY
jgi:hypothetical protein